MVNAIRISYFDIVFEYFYIYGQSYRRSYKEDIMYLVGVEYAQDVL